MELMGRTEQIQPIHMSNLYESTPDLASLDDPFTEVEVHQAVKDLAPNKASGPDGLPNEFIKQHWQTLQPHVMRIFSDLHEHRADFSLINEATIVLIPKHETPTTVSDFRPISIINLVPKLVSKVLANRIKPHMDHLVSEHQTAFVQGRFIAENFLSAREVLYHVHQSGSPAVLLKLDFAKAYDIIHWTFLLNVLRVRGFPSNVIRWIAHLLSTATSRILLNGQLTTPFSHKRGLRQGDPLSPYLFILAADIFQRMTIAASVHARSPLTKKIPQSIINFQYADDTIIVSSARGSTLRLLMLAIHCFAAVSGLKINLQKSVFVPLAIEPDRIRSIELLLQCNRQSLPITYLGMPLTIKRPTRAAYNPLLQKLEQRLEGWKARFISRGGRLQLVKSVLSSIPTYFMSCFKFPKWLLARIDTIRRTFFWSRNGNSQAIPLMNWRKICMPTKCGGMGVIDLQLQNTALLLRWLWRMYATNQRLWAQYATRLYALKWTQDGPLILSKSGSFFWASLLSFKPIFHTCAKFRIVSGTRISFWFDTWARQPIASTINGPFIRKGISLLEAKRFATELLPTPLTADQHEAIQLLAGFTPTQGPDQLIWNLSASGQFSTESVYKLLSTGGKIRSSTSSIWKAKVPPSWRCFFFLFLNDRLLTHDIMDRRHLSYQPGCVMCARLHLETAQHLFFLCPYAHQVWMGISLASGFRVVSVKESLSLTYLSSMPLRKDRRVRWMTLFITTVWLLWRERNERIFRAKETPAYVILNKILQEAQLCLRFC